MHEEKFVVKADEVDSFKEIRISTLLRHMQDVIANHADKLNIGINALKKDHNIWVVVRTELLINRLPKLKEKYFISTHPGETKGFMFPRFVQVYDKHHQLLVSMSSIWVVINFETRKICLHPFKETNFKFESSVDDLPLPNKINETALIFVYTRVTKESEIDNNMHVNNTYYYDYIFDSHDEQFFIKNKIKRIAINFEKEIPHPHSIDIYSNISNPEIIVGKIDNTISFVSKVEYIKR